MLAVSGMDVGADIHEGAKLLNPLMVGRLSTLIDTLAVAEHPSAEVTVTT